MHPTPSRLTRQVRAIAAAVLKLALIAGATVLDAVCYEGPCPIYAEGTGLGVAASDDNTSAAMGISRIPDGADTDNNSTDFRFYPITPGMANGCDTPTSTSIATATSAPTETPTPMPPASD